MFDDLNNKSFSILPTKQELGLEMALDPGTILGIASVGTSILGGIFGSNQQKSNERAAKKAEEKRVDAINDYNKKRFKNDKANYQAERDYNWRQAIRKYEYESQLAVRGFETQVKAYTKDQQNLSNQLAYNKIAERTAYLREQNVMRDIKSEQVFGRQQLYVDALKQKASAKLSASGTSTDRAALMALAEKGRNLAVLDASYTGAVRESNLNMFDIALAKSSADTNAQQNTMLAPTAPLPLIKPEQTPELKFTEPGEAIAGFVPSSSSAATILGGIANGLSGLSSLDFSPGTQAPSPLPTAGNPFAAGQAAFNRSYQSSPFFRTP